MSSTQHNFEQIANVPKVLLLLLLKGIITGWGSSAGSTSLTPFIIP